MNIGTKYVPSDEALKEKWLTTESYVIPVTSSTGFRRSLLKDWGMPDNPEAILVVLKSDYSLDFINVADGWDELETKG